jgi:hypothetical protein
MRKRNAILMRENILISKTKVITKKQVGEKKRERERERERKLLEAECMPTLYINHLKEENREKELGKYNDDDDTCKS